MLDWVLNMPLFTVIFSFRKRSEWKKISSLKTFNSKELKKLSDCKKGGAVLDDTYKSNGTISLKLID